MHITKEKLNKFRIPIPPLDEQKRIVALIGAASAKIGIVRANLRQNVDSADHLFRRQLEGWISPSGALPNVSLYEVCKINAKLVDPRDSSYRRMKHVGAGNIIEGTGRLIDVQTAEDERLISGKFTFDQDAVLYSKIRPYLRKIVRPDFPGLCSADIYPLIPEPSKMTRNFLYWLLFSEGFTNYVIGGSARSGMPKVNRDHLFAFQFHLPSMNDQMAISNRLDGIWPLIGEVKDLEVNRIQLFSELASSIQTKAFAGAL